jgi:hypothetical protein
MGAEIAIRDTESGKGVRIDVSFQPADDQTAKPESPSMPGGE